MAARLKKWSWVRIGIPVGAGLGILVYGFIYGQMALMIMGLLLNYIGWQKFEQFRIADKIFGAIEHLAEAMDQQSIMPDE
ncbi:MAG: hypothetical protein ACQETE_12735 [Bacteroidota bacterium]